MSNEALKKRVGEIAGPVAFQMCALQGRIPKGIPWVWEELDQKTRDRWIKEESEVSDPIIDALHLILAEESEASAELRQIFEDAS